MVRPIAVHVCFQKEYAAGFGVSSSNAGKIRSDVERRLRNAALTDRLSQYSTHVPKRFPKLQGRFLHIKIPRFWGRLFAVVWVAKLAKKANTVFEFIFPIGVTINRKEFVYRKGLNPYLEQAKTVCDEFDRACAENFQIWVYNTGDKGFVTKQYSKANWPFLKRAN